MKKIAILGSTGSIGTQTLEVVRENQDIQVMALAAGSNIELLEETHNPLSSLAMSFDRIYVHTSSGDDVLVAVKEKKAFIEEVYRRAGIF